jgi:hypothetical protein
MPEDLIASWTLVEADWRLVANKTGATRLGFALLLKFFELEARFPRHLRELPRQAVEYVAQQVKVPATEIDAYDWTGRSIKYHRVQIREAYGFRECAAEDEARLTAWLAEDVCQNELGEERQREALLARCRAERLEPPGPSRVDRVLAAGRTAAEQRFCAQTVARLSAEAIDRLEELAGAAPGDGGRGLLAELKADPGPLGLETLLIEIAKLGRARAIGLPTDLFAGVSEKLVTAWRARAATQYPSDLQAMAQPVRITLLAALCWQRSAELTDGLVDLLIQLVQRINARAESRVEGEMVADLRRVVGKQGILFRLAGAALEQPDETVRRAIYPVVGEGTLRDLVKEAMANEAAMKRRIRTVLRSSYSNHYRRMLPQLLAALEFRCNNTAYRPVMDAIDLLRRYAERKQARWYDASERVPIQGVVPLAWEAAVVDERGRVERIPYELCLLGSLRNALRRREVWVVGAARWRDPEADLPQDFEDHREVHYAAIRQPLDAGDFVADLRGRLDGALRELAVALRDGRTGGIHLTQRRGEPWFNVPRCYRRR